MTEILSKADLEAELRKIGETRYHSNHPFQIMLQEGRLSKSQVQAWALNRYYYQSMIPVKDSHILARLDSVELRQEWRERIIDHDGTETERGGIVKWIALAEGVGLDKAYVMSGEGILPGTRFAVDAYVHFVRDRPLLEAIASSLTELFSPNVIGVRTKGMLQHYDFITPDTLAYFDKRPVQAKRDSDFALNYCLDNAVRPEQQQAVIGALKFKCQVLWTQLDALSHAYVEPGHIPFDAWTPGTMLAPQRSDAAE